MGTKSEMVGDQHNAKSDLVGEMELTTGIALLARLRELPDGLHIPPDYCPQSEEECSWLLREAVQLLKTNNSSGYAHVFPVKGRKPWQAKPYIRPRVQRSLGSFYTAEEAAEAVVSHALGLLPTPPTPPARNRRGEGRRPRDRRKKRPAAEAGDVQVLYECAIGSEDEDGVQWYE